MDWEVAVFCVITLMAAFVPARWIKKTSLLVAAGQRDTSSGLLDARRRGLLDARRHNRSVDHPQTQQHNRSHFLDARRALRRSRGRGRRGLLDDLRHIRLQVQNVVARIEAIESTILPTR